MSTAEARPIVFVEDLHVYLGGSHVPRVFRSGCPRAASPRCWVATASGRRPRCGRSWASSCQRTGEPRRRGHQPGPTHRIVQRGVGYVPEDRDVFAGLTVEENPRLAERNGPAHYELVYDLFPELKQWRQRAGTLSGGSAADVAIARALLNDNRVLLIDEPTKGLAPFLVTEVAGALEHAAEATTILLVEQNLGVVQRLARDVVVLDQGRVVHTGPGAGAPCRRDARPAPARCRRRPE